MDLLIWGAGGHAAVVADIARQTGWKVVAFVDDRPGDRPDRTWCNAPVVDAHGAEAMVRGDVRHAAVAIGHPRVRLAKAKLVMGWGCVLPTLIHPRAVIADSADLGSGTVVCAGAVVQPLARMGPLCVVNTLASADHDCELAEATHVCPGARLGGHVRTGNGVWVGIGASVRDRVNLGDWSLIGAGAAVVTDVSPNTLAYGVPAIPRGRSAYAEDETFAVTLGQVFDR
jgi:sugar O-acyltransferase (sialic acid O-acetyltransferase NeuD family)